MLEIQLIKDLITYSGDQLTKYKVETLIAFNKELTTSKISKVHRIKA